MSKKVSGPPAAANYFSIAEIADYSTSNFSYGSQSISPIQVYDLTQTSHVTWAAKLTILQITRYLLFTFA